METLDMALTSLDRLIKTAQRKRQDTCQRSPSIAAFVQRFYFLENFSTSGLFRMTNPSYKKIPRFSFFRFENALEKNSG